MKHQEIDIKVDAGKSTYWVVNYSKNKLIMIAHPEESKLRPDGEAGQRLSREMIDFMGLKRFQELHKRDDLKQISRVFPYRIRSKQFWVKSTITVSRRLHEIYITGVTGIIKEGAAPLEQYYEVLSREFQFIKNLAIPAFICDEAGCILVSNPAVNKQLKKRQSSLFSQDLLSIFEPKSQAPRFNLKQPHNFVGIFEDRFKNKSQFHITSSPFITEGTLYHMVHCVNQSKEDQIDHTINALSEQIEQLVRLREKLLSWANHQLKAPINRILGLAQIMEKELENEEALEYVDMIKISAQRLLETAKGMIETAKLEVHDLNNEFEIVSIDDILSDIAHSIEREVSQKELKFELKRLLNDGHLIGDRFLIGECIRIAVSNAVQHTKSGKITLEIVQPSEEEVSICILDTGDHFDQQVSKGKLDQSKSQGIAGEGISLEVVEKYLEFMGGRMHISRRKSGGNAVYLRFVAAVLNSN